MSELVTELIEVGVIHHHPENPRKDLGDLSELKESIKKNGIMQNLTIIPGWTDSQGKKYKSGYTLLIGHRRYEAAKQAGLKEVPCRVVKDLSDREQLSIMLEENMQRTDLTAWEQAKGFQMMLDLGETVDSLADKTGFSKSTIYHRVNIAKLDMDLVKEKEDDASFQLTFDCLYELEKVKDIETRNKILKEARSASDIKWRAESAQKEEIKKKRTEEAKELLERLEIREASQDEQRTLWKSTYERIKSFDLTDPDMPISLPKTFKKDTEGECFYNVGYSYIDIYRIKEEDEIEDEEKERELTPEEIERNKQAENCRRIREIADGIEENMKLFINKIIAGEYAIAKKAEPQMINRVYAYLTRKEATLDHEAYDDFIELDDETIEDEELFCQAIEEFREEHGLLVDMIIQGYLLSTRGWESLCDWRGKWNKRYAAHQQPLIDILHEYGFTLSDEEQSVLSGESDLFFKEIDEEIEDNG